jgi:hypothetical protein
MPRKGHSDEKIVFALRQLEGGKDVGEYVGKWACRRRCPSATAGAAVDQRRRSGSLLTSVSRLRMILDNTSNTHSCGVSSAGPALLQRSRARQSDS